MFTIHIDIASPNSHTGQMIRDSPHDLPYLRKAIGSTCRVCGLMRPSGEFTGTIVL